MLMEDILTIKILWILSINKKIREAMENASLILCKRVIYEKKDVDYLMYTSMFS